MIMKIVCCWKTVESRKNVQKKVVLQKKHLDAWTTQRLNGDRKPGKQFVQDLLLLKIQKTV